MSYLLKTFRNKVCFGLTRESQKNLTYLQALPYAWDINKILRYRRETALRGGLVIAKSGRLELRDNIYRHYRSIFNHCDTAKL